MSVLKIKRSWCLRAGCLSSGEDETVCWLVGTQISLYVCGSAFSASLSRSCFIHEPESPYHIDRVRIRILSIVPQRHMLIFASIFSSHLVTLYNNTTLIDNRY